MSSVQPYPNYEVGVYSIERLFEKYLNVEGPGQLVAALCLHSLHLSTMEGVKGQVLHFTIVLGGGGGDTHIIMT